MISLPLILSKSTYERLVNRTLLEAGSEKFYLMELGIRLRLMEKKTSLFLHNNKTFYTQVLI